MPRSHSKIPLFDQFFDALAESEQPAEVGAKNASRSCFVWLDLSRPADAGLNSARCNVYQSEASESDRSAPSTDPSSIALELGLVAELTTEAVAKIRRDFAQRNHPDRVQAELRDIATIRMQTANALLDAFVARPRTP